MSESEIAIIGMSGRFPGARSIEEYWRNLRDGIESIAFFPSDQLEATIQGPIPHSNPGFVKAGGVIDDIELFDAAFFDFTPREAQVLDPQHRLLLECAWETLERAGYCTDYYRGSIGVFAGSLLSTYLINLYQNREILDAVSLAQIGLCNNVDFLATGTSYKLDLKGPSFTVQTACSTSLVAVHLACQSLLDHECDMALAGGVAIRVPQRTGYIYQEGGILSPDGHCRAFDAEAKGTILTNGVGTVLLKRLADAIEDRDTIHAVIRGSAINNDGAAKVGFTAPSVQGQTAVIVEALANAGVDAASIDYVEAHGTGTTLGDPIEVEALSEAFRQSTTAGGTWRIGSVKTNIGHTDAAAGVAGLIKTTLALHHKQIPPSLHFTTPNPRIDFQAGRFVVNTELTEWQRGPEPRRAAVSSLGIGGTNAHVILEEAPQKVPTATSHREWQLLTWSAKTASALETATQNLIKHLKEHSTESLADVAFTQHVGRKSFGYRRALVCLNTEHAISLLETERGAELMSGHADAGYRPVIFMFPGQSSQHVNMGLDLYRDEPVFREELDRCSELLQVQLDCDLRDLLFPGPEQAEQAAQQLGQTRFTQPALFVLEYALAKLWMSWGVRPQAMIGHSIGEYVAACLADVFSLEDALRLVSLRGRAIQELPGGAMLAVTLSEAELESLLGPDLSIAAVNGPQHCVVSGPGAAVQKLQAELRAVGVEAQALHTSHAFHSEMMSPAIESFALSVAQVQLRPPQIPFISNVTGNWIRDDEVTSPHYWARHLRTCVRFWDGLQPLFSEPKNVLLEVGPGQALGAMARRGVGEQGPLVLSSMRHQRQTRSDSAQLLQTAGKLWLSGVQIDWHGFHAGERRQRVLLPTYPFERVRYWVEPDTQFVSNAVARPSEIGKQKLDDWFYLPSWRRSFSLSTKEQAAPGRYLVFINQTALSSQLVDRLRSRHHVVTVASGDQFKRINSDEFQLDASRPDHYEQLFATLREASSIPTRIVHLWSVESESQENSKDELNQEIVDRGFYSLLYLAQAFGKQQIVNQLELFAVSTNLHNVTNTEELSPEKSMLLAACRVIPQEYTNIRCRAIDLDLTNENGRLDQRVVIDRLVSELDSASPELVVSHRGNERWIQTFERVQVGKAAESISSLVDGGVYLLIGGLGRFGLLIAKHLAQAAKARLVLVSRTALPAREEWQNWLSTHNPTDQVSLKIKGVLALEALGAEVMLASADIGNGKEIQAVIEETVRRFGSLNGIVHAAGLQVHAAIQETNRDQCEEIFKSKVNGLFALRRALNGVDLDFCLMTSSLSPILGGLGFIAYSAANLFMDAFATYMNSSEQQPWRTINWEGWHLDQTAGEIAPAVNTGNVSNFGSEMAQLVMSDDEVIECFRRVLPLNTPQLVIATGDLNARIKRWVNLESVHEESSALPLAELPGYSRPHLRTNFEAPRDEIEQVVAAVQQSILGIEQVGIHDNFFELGGSSLLAVQFISRLRDKFQQHIPLGLLFDQPTVAGLAEAIRDAQPKESELDELAQLLAQVESMSEAEIKDRLATELQQAGGNGLHG